MSIITKLVTLVRGVSNDAGQAIVDKNALTILDQEIRDANNALMAARQDLTRLMAERSIANDKLVALQTKLGEYGTYIQAALAKNDEQLAEDTATRYAALESEIANESAAVTEMDANIERLRGTINKGTASIDALRRRVTAVKSTANVQRATQAINERTTGAGNKVATAMDSLERIQASQKLKDAQLRAAQELDSQSGDGELHRRLQAAGIIPGAADGKSVLERFKAQTPPTGA